MRKFIIIAASFAALLSLAATAAIAAPVAQPVTTTDSVTLNAAFDGVVDMPALNSQFTKMTITVNDGTANWGPANLNAWTMYDHGAVTTGWPLTSGISGSYGPLLLEGTQVGTVIYRVDGGLWNPITTPVTISNLGDGTHHVQVAYNDRPGSYHDNFGSLSLTVDRSK